MKEIPNICDFDPAAITIAQAQHVIQEQSKIISETEVVAIRQALGRVLRQSIVSTINNPPNDNSAMDGYAIKFDDLSKLSNGLEISAQNPIKLKIIGKSFAGNPFVGTVNNGEAVRIMTGAKIPTGTDVVIIQENTESDGQTVSILQLSKKGQNIRLMAEDIAVGQVVMTAGTVLTPACIGVLATMGIIEVEVTRKINVAVLSTGDELQSVGSVLKQGNIYDSNRYSLQALLNEPRYNVIEKGVLSDKLEVVEKAFLDVSNYADIVITTGGVSVGEADWIKDCVKKTGSLTFWKAAIKPGRPITFGHIRQSLFFGLPGNPVSVMITFEKFVKIALQKLAGQSQEQPIRLKAKTLSKIKKIPGRTEFQRGILSYDENQELTVITTGDQGSGILSSMSVANCLIVLGIDESGVEIGDIVTVEAFREFI